MIRHGAATLARNSDPATSHAAAFDQLDSGRNATHCALILAALGELGSATYREIHSHLDGRIAEAVEIMRRLSSNLAPIDRETGREFASSPVVRDGVTKCSVSGRAATVWTLRRAA